MDIDDAHATDLGNQELPHHADPIEAQEQSAGLGFEGDGVVVSERVGTQNRNAFAVARAFGALTVIAQLLGERGGGVVLAFVLGSFEENFLKENELWDLHQIGSKA